MKIKEAASATGLTEKAIRFYESKGLISPVTSEYNGKLYRDYGEDDIRRLKIIGELRRAMFSVEQISALLAHPEKCGEIFTAYRAELQEERDRMQKLIDAVDLINADTISSADALSEAIGGASLNLSLPERDINFSPHFARFDDGIHDDERRNAYQTFLRRQAKRDMRNDIFSYFCAVMKKIGRVALPVLAVVILLNVLCFTLYVDKSYTGFELSADDPSYSREVNVTLSGNLTCYLFRPDVFEGSVTITGWQTSFGDGYSADPIGFTFNMYDRGMNQSVLLNSLPVVREGKAAALGYIYCDRSFDSLVFIGSSDGESYDIVVPASDETEAGGLLGNLLLAMFGRVDSE